MRHFCAHLSHQRQPPVKPTSMARRLGHAALAQNLASRPKNLKQVEISLMISADVFRSTSKALVIHATQLSHGRRAIGTPACNPKIVGQYRRYSNLVSIRCLLGVRGKTVIVT
jgi:hypothetical protein